MQIGNRILVISSHPDDELLGLGGTIKKMSESGREIDLVILGTGLSSRQSSKDNLNENDLISLRNNAIEASKILGYNSINFESLPDNRFDSIDLLDIVKIIENYIDKFKPQTVFSHFYDDLNIDHTISTRAVLTATRPIKGNCVKNVILYETPSSTEWNFTASFRPNFFVDTSLHHKFKYKAMSQYTTEKRDFPHPRSEIALDSIATKWGTTIGTKYAEAFVIVRQIMD